VIDGTQTLEQLRSAGVNTEVVKRFRVTHKGDRELELHHRAGEAVDRLMSHTALKPADVEKSARLDANKPTENLRTTVQVLVPGLSLASNKAFRAEIAGHEGVRAMILNHAIRAFHEIGFTDADAQEMARDIVELAQGERIMLQKP
jgi:hypothetical protein